MFDIQGASAAVSFDIGVSVQGSMFKVQVPRPVFDIRCDVFSIRYSVFGVWCLIFRAQVLQSVFDIRSLVFNVQCAAACI